MMKTATLTFHASHNYGSMLQAYALQQVMIKIFGANEIINFRTPKQKRMMKVITMRPKIGPLLKDLIHLFYFRRLQEKYDKFEGFINNYLIITNEEFLSLSFRNLEQFDLICCGSDQIWNPCPEDFDLAYLLPFKLTAKKISYAASMGPGRAKWPEPISKFPYLLKEFDAISVRESGTQQVVSHLSGREDVEVHCDPVFLLDKSQWEKLIEQPPIVKGKYIFLYTLFANPTIIKCAKKLSRKYSIPVVISNFTNLHDLLSPFKKNLKSGPKEFLNMLYNAEMVITSSFHGTAFSILLNKPFVNVNGMADNRICNLLKIAGLISRSVSSTDEISKIDWNVDFTEANHAIVEERRRTLEYLSQFKN